MKKEVKELLRLASLEVIAPNSSKNGLSIPENFDIWKEYKQNNIKVYSGGNDWEDSPTCFMLLKSNHRGESSRLWIELNPPKDCDDFGYLTDAEKSHGLTSKDKEKLIKKQGDVFLKLWEDSARALSESSSESAKGLPNSLNEWADALRDTESLHKYVSMSGSDKTNWKKTNLLKKKKSMRHKAGELLKLAKALVTSPEVVALSGLMRVARTLKKAEETQGEPMVKMMDDLALEIKGIQSDGRVTTSEVMGLFDNMIQMINLLVSAKPPTKPRKTKSVPEVSEHPKEEAQEVEEVVPNKAKAKKKVDKISSIIDRVVIAATVRFFIDSSKKNTERYIAMDADTNFYTGHVGIRKGETFIKLVREPFRQQVRFDGLLEKGKLREINANKFKDQVTSETEMDVDTKKLYQS